MLNKILSYWSRKDTPQTGLRLPAHDNEHLPFRANLIDELESEHRVLLGLFKEFVATHRGGDIDECVAKLRRFTHSLRAHLLKENLLLYVYLAQSLRDNPESSELMKEMRMEMQRIGRSLNDFVTRYTTSPWDTATREQLSVEIDGIADILTHRIRSEEESLYPLYMPRRSYG